MKPNFDVIVIGSGFGGAITACRLAEKGMKVLVLERGRRWKPTEYPSQTQRDLLWDARHPERRNGWFEFRTFKHMVVVQGAGVGGGSLVYANVQVEATESIFRQGWPAEITLAELRPYYERVGRMLRAQRIPEGQVTRRFEVMRQGAEALGHGARFRPLELAVTFDSEYSYDRSDPFNMRHSRPWTNDEGVTQGTCVHCGNCDLGCPTLAKNTLDITYIPRAEKHGADVRALHLVDCITPVDGVGYRVDFRRIIGDRFVPGVETARRVIVAAGSMGSTELLLRCRDQHRTLARLSPFLGRNWSSNGDFLTPAFHDSTHRISPTQGPTISSAIDFLDGSVDGEQFFIEDGGFPPALSNYLQRTLDGGGNGHPLVSQLLTYLRKNLGPRIRGSDPLACAMPWFAQGIDSADGQLSLRRSWFMPWRRHLDLKWDIARSENVISAIVRMHQRLAAATGGKAAVPPSWTVCKDLITPHPLGGCNMGVTAQNGVVDHRGEVFNYPGLYVADGAIVPEAVGLNPSKTIGALAERIADLMT